MKKNIIIAAIAAVAINTTTVIAQTIKAPAFARPLVERWVNEYNRQRGTKLAVAEAGQTADITIEANVEDESNDLVAVGRYAILPFTGRDSEAAQLLAKKKLSKRRVDGLYFVDPDEDDEETENKLAKRLTVYSGSNATSVATTFARYFGHTKADLRGKRISGDDKFLVMAVGRDQSGVAFNAIGNLYDLTTRQLRREVSLVALDVRRDVADAFGPDATLDQLIEVLEQQDIEGVVVSPLALEVASASDVASDFVKWASTVGQQYNHEYGLLTLDTPQFAEHK